MNPREKAAHNISKVKVDGLIFFFPTFFLMGFEFLFNLHDDG